MVEKVLLLLFLFLQPFQFGNANVDLSYDDNGFFLKFHGIEILSHSRVLPLMSVASGQFTAEENLGNFELEDFISDVVDLTEWTINSSNGSYEINLFNANPDQKMIIRVPETQDEFLEVKFQFFGTGINRFFLRLPFDFGERIWGGGEQYTYLNLLKGSIYPIWVREQGVGRNKSSLLTQIMDIEGAGGDYHTTYWPQPSFLSSRGYHFELDIQTYSEMRFVSGGQNLTENARHVIMWHQETSDEAESVETKATFVVAPTLMRIVQSISPGQPPLPDWALQGAIIGLQGGTDRMLQILDEAKQNNVSVGAVWIQDWCGKLTTAFGKRVFWNWKWNEEWYPRLDSLIHTLASEGIKVLAYINPHLNIKGDIYLAEEMSSFWIKDSNRNTLKQDFGQFQAATIDIIKSDSDEVNAGRDWYKTLIKENLIDFGFAGWMADFGEYLPIKSYSSVNSESWGKDGEEILHQTLGEQWAKLNREVVEETSNLGKVLVWHRSGTSRSKHDVIMSWAGDQAVDWTASDGLKSSITAALSLAVSGTGLSHSDIGGYTTASVLGLTRSKELLLRWAEYSVFTPLMRTHEGNQPNANHQVYSDQETFKAFGRLTQIFSMLFPYTKSTIMQNVLEHMPVMRPLFLMFQDDEETYDIEYEYMFGDDLLVAPVTEPDAVFWTVYLPKTDQGWIWLWDPNDIPEVVPGGSGVTVQSPLGKPPVFFKEKSGWFQLFRKIGKEFNFQ